MGGLPAQMIILVFQEGSRETEREREREIERARERARDGETVRQCMEASCVWEASLLAD